MFEVIFYTDVNGFSELKEQILELGNKAPTNKDARIQLNQINGSIGKLQCFGAKQPFVDTKHIRNKIWELRPGKNRILYFYQDNNSHVLLHMFRKETKKTPKREIDKAEKEISDYLKRLKEAK